MVMVDRSRSRSMSLRVERPDRTGLSNTRWDLEKITKSNRTSKEAEYVGCILVDYKLRSKYEMGGLLYRERTGLYGDGAE